MPKIEVTVDVRIDGRRVRQFPYYFSTEVDELQADFETEVASGAGLASLPHEQLSEVHLAAYAPSGDASFSLMQDNPFTIRQGGLLLLVNALLDDGASTNARVSQSTGGVILVRGLAGGT